MKRNSRCAAGSVTLMAASLLVRARVDGARAAGGAGSASRRSCSAVQEDQLAVGSSSASSRRRGRVSNIPRQMDGALPVSAVPATNRPAANRPAPLLGTMTSTYPSSGPGACPRRIPNTPRRGGMSQLQPAACAGLGQDPAPAPPPPPSWPASHQHIATPAVCAASQGCAPIR